MGALGSKKVRTGLAAAAAGYLTYKAGKAILKAGTHYAMFGGRRYYFGNDYYNQYGMGYYGSGYRQCSYPIGRDDTELQGMFYPDQRPIRHITFGCRTYEQCCGMECCPMGGGTGGGGMYSNGYHRRGPSLWMPLLFTLLILACCCCGGFFILYKFFRHLLDCVLGPSNDSNNRSYRNTDANKFDGVPMQPSTYPTYPPQQNPYH